MRAGAGLGAAIYDPAARGFLTDATPPDRRGEAFGLYGAAQMGGLLLGPTIGAFGAAWFGGIAFVFVFSAVAAVVAAVGIALRVREEGYERRAHPTPLADRTALPPGSPFLEGATPRTWPRMPGPHRATPPPTPGPRSPASQTGPPRCVC